jgi:hypothetical protein
MIPGSVIRGPTLSGSRRNGLDSLVGLFSPQTVFVFCGISAAIFVVAILSWVFFESPPSPKSDDPGYRSVHYLLGSIYSGSSTCKILKNRIGTLIAPGLMECSGWGYSLVVRNAKNGCVLDIREKFDIELVSEEGDKKVFLDTKNLYYFEVDGLLILDFYKAPGSESPGIGE